MFGDVTTPRTIVSLGERRRPLLLLLLLLRLPLGVRNGLLRLGHSYLTRRQYVGQYVRRCLTGFACLAGLEAARRYRLWRVNRRLPQSIRYGTNGLLDFVGYYEVLDPAVLKDHAKALVHPTAGARVYMGGLREENILCSPGGVWGQQQAIIHKFIRSHVDQYLTLLQNTELVLEGADGRVDLLEAVGRYVTHISTSPMGLTFKGGFRWRVMATLFFVVGAFPHIGPLEGIVKFVLRKLMPLLDAERQIGKFVDETETSFVRDLAAQFGRHETIGHLWAIINGSIIPETNMICSILHELAMDPAAQEAVHQMVRQDDMATVTTNEAFEAWVAGKCREHAFFRSTSRIAEESLDVGGYVIPQGADLRIPIDKLNALPGVALTWGFGKRRCPGAQIGKNIIKLTISRIMRRYRIALEDTAWSFKTVVTTFFPFGMAVRCYSRGDASADTYLEPLVEELDEKPQADDASTSPGSDDGELTANVGGTPR